MASESNPDNLKSRETSQFRPEELPPVTPPSAGFIVQLFLIPALIVMAVVAVWALFGKLADSDNDWKQLATELSSSNEHRRWRAALGLAQLLQNEQIYPPRDQQPLATNPVVVDSLTQLLSESLASTTTTEKQFPQRRKKCKTVQKYAKRTARMQSRRRPTKVTQNGGLTHHKQKQSDSAHHNNLEDRPQNIVEL